MIKLFYNRDPFISTVSKDSNLRYIKERFKHEIKNVKEYYNAKNAKVENSNMFVGLITTLCPNYNLDLWEFSRIIDSTAKYNSKTFDIVSSINKGNIVKNQLFGKNSYEIFIYKEMNFDITDVEDCWRDLSPLTIRRHDNTNIFLKIPSDKVRFDVPTITICELDIKMMLLQYKYWSLERLSNNMDTDPAYYVYRYLFANTCAQFLDLAILNKLINKFTGESDDENINYHPFNILDMSSRINRVLVNVYTNILDSNKSYSNILMNIPLINVENAYSLLLMDNSLYNKQSMWAHWLLVIPYIYFILCIGKDKTITHNKDTVNQVRLTIKEIDRNQIDDKLLDNIEIGIDYLFMKENIIEKIGIR